MGHFDSDIFTQEEAAHITAIKRRVLEESRESREQMWLERPGGRIASHPWFRHCEPPHTAQVPKLLVVGAEG